MKKIFSILTLLTLPIFLNQALSAQQNQDDVVRITTNLVQVDATVTDKDGKPVTNLTAEDFEIFQDGKSQKITGVSFVNLETRNAAQATAKNSGKNDKNSPLAPPIRANAADAGRLLTFIVDDGSCFASQLGMVAAREGLEKFIREQMQPDDFVAIYQTRAGNSMLQQFTSDKNRLLKTARQIRWRPPLMGCVNDATGDFFNRARSDSTLSSRQPTFETAESKAAREKIEEIGRDRQTIGTLSVLRYVLRGLQRIGGRKTVFVMSDGLALQGLEGATGRALDIARELTDAATRASVVFHTIDVRGVNNPLHIGADSDLQPNIKGDPSMQMNEIEGTRRDQVKLTRALENGLFFLANETGGRFYRNNNFLDVPIRRALGLERGYYLIAYEPGDETFRGKQFHEIEIKVKKPDLNVRSRSGFYGVTNEAIRPKPRTESSDLYEAIVAPLANADLDLRLSAFYGNTRQTGDFVRALVYVDGRQITFADEPNGMKKAVFDVVAVTFNEKNEPVDDFNKTHIVRFPAANLASVQQNGMIYTADVPVKKAGVYNFRIAMRDAASRQLGSAAQQIEVPELQKGKLLLSNPIIGEAENNSGKMTAPSVGEATNGFSPVQSISSPAIRRFRPGAVLGYSYKIYNAAVDKTSGQPKLTVQVRLYRNGELVTDSPAAPTQLEPQTDLKRINDYGFMRLPPNALTGDYALQIIVKDLVKNETTAQSIDFEVVD
ncbi:MAG TPA: VWA domain-containing protein [Pyrinomonadaceae bacterium]